MKKLLHISYCVGIIIFFLNNYTFGQSCSGSSQWVELPGYPSSKWCLNSPSSFYVDIFPTTWNIWDEYGWHDEGSSFQSITVKRPDGSTALEITPDMITQPLYLGNGYYNIPGGFFNVVGDWIFSFYSYDPCTGWSTTYNITLKVVGTYSNLIGSDEIFCNSGGTPQNIVNVSLASNSTYTTRWQSKTGAGSWNDISGANLASYQPPYINQTTLYRRIITTDEQSCVSNPSNEVAKYVYPALTNGSIGSNKDVCYNVTPAVISETTQPTGGSSYPNYGYQWYSSNDNINWNPITGATGSNYQPSFILGYRYYRRLTIDGSCGQTFTNSVQIHGYDNLTPGSIGSDQLICYGTTPSAITVTAIETGGIGSNSYQWYSSPNGSSWSAASGSSSGQNYQPPALTSKTYYQKAIINSCGTVYTNPVIIDVRTNLSSGSIGNDQTICNNDIPAIIATLVNPTGGSNSYTYAWESSTNNTDWNPIPGTNQVSYQPAALPQTTYFKKKIIDANCNSVYTNTVTVSTRQAFSIGSIGSSQTICNGATPILITNSTTPTGGQGTYTYIWENSLNNTDWSIITGATGVSFQPPVLAVTTHYRRKVTDLLCGNGYNSPVTISVRPVFSVGSIGSNQTICINTAPALLSSFSPSGGMGGYIYFWESSLNGTDFNIISGAVGETYQPGALSQTTYYRRHVTDASCGNDYTNIAKITVRSDYFYGTIGSNQTIFFSGTPFLLSTTVPASGGSGSYIYQWQKSENGTDWFSIPEATMTEYQPGSLARSTYYRIMVTDASCSGSAGYTNVVVITVTDQLVPGSISADQTICFRTIPNAILGSSPSGGTGIFSFKWMKSLNGTDWIYIVGEVGASFQPTILTGDTYFRREVTSGSNSSFSNTVKITVYQPLTIPATDVKSIYCKGSNFQLNVVNPVYISYKWYDSFQTYLQDGTLINVANLTSDKKYYLKALNVQGCYSDPAEISLSVDKVKAGFSQDITSVNLGDPIKFTSTSVNALKYAWNFFDGDIINEQNPVHYYNILNTKKFSVKLTVTSPGGCLDSLLLDEIITVNNITGIESNKSETFSYHPNPVKEKLLIKSGEKIKTIKILNTAGSVIRSLIFDSEIVTVDFSGLKSGIYLLEINGLFDSRKNIKIIKQ